MLELALIALPALVILATAAVVVRRERDGSIAASTVTLHVPHVTVEGSDWSRAGAAPPKERSGDLVEPAGQTLGGRLHRTSMVSERCRSSRPIRVRPLVARRP